MTVALRFRIFRSSGLGFTYGKRHAKERASSSHLTALIKGVWPRILLGRGRGFEGLGFRGAIVQASGGGFRGSEGNTTGRQFMRRHFETRMPNLHRKPQSLVTQQCPPEDGCPAGG